MYIPIPAVSIQRVTAPNSVRVLPAIQVGSSTDPPAAENEDGVFWPLNPMTLIVEIFNGIH